ncbi:MAG: recombinase family protein [Flavobacteriales bacterium AspAUS03]
MDERNMLMVWKLDRLGRSIRQLVTLVDLLNKK